MQQHIPSFVGNDYFCEAGTVNTGEIGVLYPDDLLWDGKGCTLQPDCCSYHPHHGSVRNSLTLLLMTSRSGSVQMKVILMD